MPGAALTELQIPVGTTVLADRLAIIRQSITAAGFPATNYDEWTNGTFTNWVVEYIWDATKPKGRIFLWFRYLSVSAASERLYLSIYDNWNIPNHRGTNGSLEVVNDLNYNPLLGYPLKITAISHPEVKGFIWQQEDRFGTLCFVRPLHKYHNQFDDVNHCWCFTVNSLWDTAYYLSVSNPLKDRNSWQIESWSFLKNRFPGGTQHQLVAKPKIILNNNQGFLGAFEDVFLVNSNELAWKTPINDGNKQYLLFCRKNYSGVAIYLGNVV